MTMFVDLTQAEPVEPSPTMTVAPSLVASPSPTMVGPAPHGPPSAGPTGAAPSGSVSPSTSPSVLPTTGPGGSSGVTALVLMGALILVIGIALYARARRGHVH
jgi:LPXTG cell wall anchor motif